MSGVRGVPEQELPENQDESVRFLEDQMTGRKVELDSDGNEVEGSEDSVQEAQKEEEKVTEEATSPKRRYSRKAELEEQKESGGQ